MHWSPSAAGTKLKREMESIKSVTLPCQIPRRCMERSSCNVSRAPIPVVAPAMNDGVRAGRNFARLVEHVAAAMACGRCDN